MAAFPQSADIDDNTNSTTSTQQNDDSVSQDKNMTIYPVYHCWICAAEFGDKLGIVKHIKEYHKDRPELKGIERRMKNPICLVCGCLSPCPQHRTEKYKAIQDMGANDDGGSGEDEVSCDNDVFDKLCDDENGRISVSHPRVLYCVTCEAPFSSPEALHQHRFSEHSADKCYQCTYCPSTFAEHSHLVLHMRIHTGRHPYICEICGNRFAKGSELKRHVMVHNGHKPFKCELCNQSFTQKCSLEKHARIHAKESGGYSCSWCGLVFKVIEELIEHASSVHKNAHWQCKTCGKLYKEERHLRLHEKGHLAVKPYHCKYCDQTFVTQLLQLRHENRVHHLKTQIKCDECGKQFTRRENLTRHKQSHRGIKNFKCEVCGQAFAEKGSLTRHTRSQHDQLKPYTCSLCPRAFTRRILLHNHLERHHSGNSNVKMRAIIPPEGAVLFKCKLCEKVLRKSGMRQHARLHRRKGDVWEGSIEDKDAKKNDSDSNEENMDSEEGDGEEEGDGGEEVADVNDDYGAAFARYQEDLARNEQMSCGQSE